MFVYRITKEQYVNDLSGEGSRQHGGRWNTKGSSMIYTAENRSLSTVEYLVHIPISIIPGDIFITKIYIPDNIELEVLDKKILPENWATYPAPLILAELGSKWIKENRYTALKVPSAIVKGEWNILLNPNHRFFNKIKIIETEEYNFDDRLTGKKDTIN